MLLFLFKTSIDVSALEFVLFIRPKCYVLSYVSGERRKEEDNPGHRIESVSSRQAETFYNMHRNFTRFSCINDAAFEAITETVLYRKSIRFRTVEGAATPALCHEKLHNDG